MFALLYVAVALLIGFVVFYVILKSGALEPEIDLVDNHSGEHN